MISREIAYIGQRAGIAVEGLMDTFASKGAARRAAGDYSTIEPTAGWIQKIAAGSWLLLSRNLRCTSIIKRAQQ